MKSPERTQPEVGEPATEIVVLIPAYRPGWALTEIVEQLAGKGFACVVVIDDGSGSECRHIFDGLLAFPRIHVIRHAVNLGKGAALKTGINFALVEYPDLTGVVTADADGQHDPTDIVRVAERFSGSAGALILGARTFSGSVPLRSRFGNALTRHAMRLAVGHQISDTQTGLRAIPRAMLERLLRIPAQGYEFELEMLIAARHPAVEIIEQPIRTIYEAGNPSSHFHPLRDSMRIYFVLLRFASLSLITSVLDNAVFYVLFPLTGNVLASLIGARVLALTFNYSLVRSVVFHSREPHGIALPRYLTIGVVYICISWGLIGLVSNYLRIGVVPTKFAVESFLFFVNFIVQRDFVFARRSSAQPLKSTA